MAPSHVTLHAPGRTAGAHLLPGLGPCTADSETKAHPAQGYIFGAEKKKCCPSEGSKYILLRFHVISERRGLVPIPYPAHPLACTRHPQSAFLARGAPPARDAVGETGIGNGSF